MEKRRWKAGLLSMHSFSQRRAGSSDQMGTYNLSSIKYKAWLLCSHKGKLRSAKIDSQVAGRLTHRVLDAYKGRATDGMDHIGQFGNVAHRLFVKRD